MQSDKSIVSAEIAAAPGARSRLLPLDALRGLIMLLMALDHVRDYFSNARYPPLDLAHTTPALFLTRWVTHFCAPGFVLLAGTSAFLWAAARRKSKAELARYLLTRGAWLIVLELTVVRLAWFLDLDYRISLAQVIWAIGWSMIALAGMMFLPDSWILAIAMVMIAGHNMLDRVNLGNERFPSSLWSILHRPGLLEVWPGHSLYVLYPLIPWIGVMAFGYWMGRLYEKDGVYRRKWLLAAGILLVAAFVALRFSNLYGDPTHWHRQEDGLFTLLAFVNLEKYPPSFLFLMMTLGPLFIGLALLESYTGRLVQIAATFGRVPLFYYVVHLFGIHLAAVGVAMLRYGQAGWLFGSAWLFREGYPADYGYGLVGVYLIWILAVLLLYPICVWFVKVKQQSRNGWLSYL